MDRRRIAAALLALAPAGAGAQAPPSLTRNCDAVNPLPRPCAGVADVTTLTSFYFEVTVPSTNGAAHAVDPATLAATLTGPGGPEPMLLPGGVAAPGWTTTVSGPFTDGGRQGHGVHLVRAAPLASSTPWSVAVSASTISGLPIDPASATWSFTTRRSLAGAAATLPVDMSAAPVTWPGRWFNGILKPNFDTSALFDQDPVYALMDEARLDAPDFMEHQRDWPLCADYWSGGGFFDGNPNLMRERETRRIVAIRDDVAQTVLTLADLLEGPLYGIAPGRPLSGDYAPGHRVLVCDRGKSEAATVLSVDDAARTVTVSLLANAAPSWILDYPGSQPADDPRTPGNFSYPLGALRKLDPHGTPVFYWDRLHDEWDRHVARGRKPIVNFEAVPIDACRRGRADAYGGSCPDLPKSFTEWDDVVRAIVGHLIDRYGPQVATWRFSIGNEPDLPIFWDATDDEFLSWYDHTASSILRAIEDAGLDSGPVVIGGLEATGLFPGYVGQILHHASPASVNPSPGFEERNHACIDPGFDARLSARVRALCDAQGDLGTPLDFLSVHSYDRASGAAATIVDARRRSLAIDPVAFDRLVIMSHETTPDWVPRRDPASRDMYRWGGYFTTWGADYVQRLLEAGEADPRYLGGEATLTVWPFNPGFAGYTSLAGQIPVDEDGDGASDRVAAIPLPFFHFAHLAATMSHELRTIAPVDDAGQRLAGFRAVRPDGDDLLVYAHDEDDPGGEETGGVDVTLRLSGLRYAAADVTEYRLDREHPARAALDALAPVPNVTYPIAQVQPLVDAARLAPAGPPRRVDAVAGVMTIPARVLSQGLVFLRLRRPDSDADGIFDDEDCAPLDASNPPPGEAAGLRVARPPLSPAPELSWDAAAGATSYDVLRESEGFGRVGLAPDGRCVAGALAATTLADPDAASPALVRYLVRARNPCGAGPWGSASDGVPRSSAACP